MIITIVSIIGSFTSLAVFNNIIYARNGFGCGDGSVGGSYAEDGSGFTGGNGTGAGVTSSGHGGSGLNLFRITMSWVMFNLLQLITLRKDLIYKFDLWLLY